MPVKKSAAKKAAPVATEKPKVFRRLPLRSQDKLIEAHMPLAKSIATAAFRRLPNHPFKDILGAAHLGLVDAARRFKPGMKVPFEAYARTRISGSIIDAHRALHRVGYVNEFPPEPAIEADAYTQDLEQDQLRGAFKPLLKLLNQFELEVIRLRYAQDMTIREIADALGTSEGTVSATHRRVLDMLRPRCEGLR